MVVKRAHSEADVEALSKKFREDWSEGQVIRSWLRRHGEELRNLVRHEDWAWVNIGRALSQAGIQFKTGKSWTGENLRRAVDLAMKPKAARASKSQAPFTAPAPASPPVLSSPPSSPPPPRPSGEPEFRIIQRKER
ncbi:MAG: hypothetical protein V4527_05355 [Pseudomonadota bacterium]